MNVLIDFPRENLSRSLGFLFDLAWKSLVPLSQVVTFLSLSMYSGRVQVDVRFEIEEAD